MLLLNIVLIVLVIFGCYNKTPETKYSVKKFIWFIILVAEEFHQHGAGVLARALLAASNVMEKRKGHHQCVDGEIP